MNEKDLLDIVADIQASPQECEWVEVKRNNYSPELIGEYVSALSNGAAYMGQSKGFLAFGIDDATHELVGTAFQPKTEKIGNQEIENWIATQLSPRIDFVIHEVVVKGKRVVLVIIDAAGNTPVKFRNKAYIRIGSYKKPLSDHPERERKIWQNTHHYCFETQIAKSGVSAAEVLRLIDHRAAFRLLDIPQPQNKKHILEKLSEEQIVKKRAASYDVTNLGALLFATNLDDFESLSRKAMRIIVYKSNNRLDAMNELVEKRGYAVGFEDMVNHITAVLPMNEEIGKALRKDTPVYPPIAVREFIANALIHQDFSIGGTSPMVEIFSSRLEITNPGKPLIDTLRFIDHAPLSRNERLAAMMRRMNFCEERGSGVDRAISQFELYQLPAPDISQADLYTKVVMFAPKTMRQMNKEDKTRACYQHCCLQYVAGEKMTNESFRNRLNISQANYSMASRIISETIGVGLIKLDDASRSRKFAQYVPIWA